jgi:hypothetical protein
MRKKGDVLEKRLKRKPIESDRQDGLRGNVSRLRRSESGYA